jgi:hypothetical protein
VRAKGFELSTLCNLLSSTSLQSLCEICGALISDSFQDPGYSHLLLPFGGFAPREAFQICERAKKSVKVKDRLLNV